MTRKCLANLHASKIGSTGFVARVLWNITDNVAQLVVDGCELSLSVRINEGSVLDMAISQSVPVCPSVEAGLQGM